MANKFRGTTWNNARFGPKIQIRRSIDLAELGDFGSITENSSDLPTAGAVHRKATGGSTSGTRGYTDLQGLFDTVVDNQDMGLVADAITAHRVWSSTGAITDIVTSAPTGILAPLVGAYTAGAIPATFSSPTGTSTIGSGIFNHGFHWDSTGTYYYQLNQSNSTIYRFVAATPWDQSTLTSQQTISAYGSSSKYGITVGEDGLNTYHANYLGEVIQTPLSVAHDLSSAGTPVTASVRDLVASELGLTFTNGIMTIWDLSMSIDGTSMFALVTGDDNLIVKLRLLTPYDISTVEYANSISDWEGKDTTTNQTLRLTPNRMFTVVSGTIRYWNLANDYELPSSFSADGTITSPSTGNSSSIKLFNEYLFFTDFVDDRNRAPGVEHNKLGRYTIDQGSIESTGILAPSNTGDTDAGTAITYNFASTSLTNTVSGNTFEDFVGMRLAVNGTTLMSSHSGSTPGVKFYDTETGELLNEFDTSQAQYNDMTGFNSEYFIGSAWNDAYGAGTIWVHDMSSGNLVKQIQGQGSVNLGNNVNMNDTYIISTFQSASYNDKLAVYEIANVLNDDMTPTLIQMPNGASISRISNIVNNKVCVSEAGAGADLHVFDISTGTLLQTITNPLSSNNINDFFGYSIAMTDTHVAVNAKNREDSSVADPDLLGYVFEIETGNLVSTFSHPDAETTTNHNYNVNVALNDEYVFFGSTRYTNESGETPFSGKVFVFDINTGTLVNTIENPNSAGTSDGDKFGTGIAVAGGKLFVGAPNEDNTTTSTGSIYTFSAAIENAPAESSAPVTTLSLTSSIAGGNSANGNMFEVVNTGTNTVTITGFSQNFESQYENPGVDVYYRTIDPVEGPWTLAGSTGSFFPEPEGTLTALTFESPVSISFGSGETIELYIVTPDDSDYRMSYTTGISNTLVVNNDSNITIYEGAGVGSLFGPDYRSRIWNGTIFYTVE